MKAEDWITYEETCEMIHAAKRREFDYIWNYIQKVAKKKGMSPYQITFEWLCLILACVDFPDLPKQNDLHRSDITKI